MRQERRPLCILAGVSSPSPTPARVLGPISATSIVIGAIIGVGIFFTPASMARLTHSGPLLLLAWGIGGLISLCGALVFAELGGRYNGNGAQYEVLRDAYGPLPAFLFVFCNATAIQSGAIGVIATICAQNLFVAAGREAPAGYTLLSFAAALIVAITLTNIIGVRWGSAIQNFTVFSKIITIIAIAAIAAFIGPSGTPPSAHPTDPASTSPWLGVLGALVPAMFSYGGWQQALWISGEVRNPAKNLPRSILTGVVLVVALYMLANWSYLKLLGVQSVAASTTLAADAVAAAYPHLGRRIIAGAVGISAFGVLNAQLLAGPRLVYGMARDGRFFRAFGRIAPRLGTPVAAILLLSTIATALLFAAGFNGVDRLTTGSVFIDSVFFVLTGAAIFILRTRGLQTSFKMPGYPLIPALFILGEVGALIGAYVKKETASAAWIGVAWIIGAALLYLVRFRSSRPVNPNVCPNCGYSREGLRSDVCPECGEKFRERTQMSS
jgi:APA family basic amino acid/polyamine antiporter